MLSAPLAGPGWLRQLLLMTSLPPQRARWLLAILPLQDPFQPSKEVSRPRPRAFLFFQAYLPARLWCPCSLGLAKVTSSVPEEMQEQGGQGGLPRCQASWKYSLRAGTAALAASLGMPSAGRRGSTTAPRGGFRAGPAGVRFCPG